MIKKQKMDLDEIAYKMEEIIEFIDEEMSSLPEELFVSIRDVGWELRRIHARYVHNMREED